MRWAAFLAMCAVVACAQGKAAPKTRVTVPFVGCASGGQPGPEEVPHEPSARVGLSAQAAGRLAMYSAVGLRVLAPRGWYCFGTYGSGGDQLYVSAAPIDIEKLFSSEYKGMTGPAVELAHRFGGTSGRFSVAEVIARVFPDYLNFVKEVEKEGFGAPFPRGPYAADKLMYKSKSVVEFETPAGMEGLGTHSFLTGSSGPIRGVAMVVGDETDVMELFVRLPKGMETLAPLIIQQVEREKVQR